MNVGVRLLVAASGLAGLLGVAASAMAAHVTGGGSLAIAGTFLLIHAAALLGLAALVGQGLVSRRLGLLAGAILVAGLVLFCGDIALRVGAGVTMFRWAPPTGGFLMMAGWALVATASLRGRGASVG
ncbi:DUF423 domain-containing protein [Salinarimonas sp.]|uniref:DUF423 domain-containing protein n=1 Tax=Salinarimonas sp. TaxID=2766526 RepID=UPI00391DD3D9